MTNREKLEKKNERLEATISKKASKLGGLLDINKLVAQLRDAKENKEKVDTLEIMKDYGMDNSNHEFDEQYYIICDIRGRLEDIARNNRQMKSAIEKDERKAKREAKKAEQKRIIDAVENEAINTFLQSWKENFIQFVKKDVKFKYETNERINQIADNEVEAKKLDLINRITKEAGAIVDASYLTIGNNGSINGKVVGEKETVWVETIFAGGYNIQRLHYRVLVNKVK